MNSNRQSTETSPAAHASTRDTNRVAQCSCCGRKYRIPARASLAHVSCPHCGQSALGPSQRQREQEAVEEMGDGPSRLEILRRPSTNRELGVLEFASGGILLLSLVASAWYLVV